MTRNTEEQNCEILKLIRFSSNRTISLICHASKIILEVIHNGLKPRIEYQMAEEQAGFRSGRSTIEQILSLKLN